MFCYVVLCIRLYDITTHYIISYYDVVVHGLYHCLFHFYPMVQGLVQPKPTGRVVPNLACQPRQSINLSPGARAKMATYNLWFLYISIHLYIYISNFVTPPHHTHAEIPCLKRLVGHYPTQCLQSILTMSYLCVSKVGVTGNQTCKPFGERTHAKNNLYSSCASVLQFKLKLWCHTSTSEVSLCYCAL